jgi:hypothetical protein
MLSAEHKETLITNEKKILREFYFALLMALQTPSEYLPCCLITFFFLLSGDRLATSKGFLFKTLLFREVSLGCLGQNLALAYLVKADAAVCLQRQSD